MDNLDKVEIVREKCGVSYQDAKDALEACEYDVLDAIIYLENVGKATQKREVVTETTAEVAEDDVVYELIGAPKPEEASNEYDSQKTASHTEFKDSKTAKAWKGFCSNFKNVINASLEMTFIAERNGEQVFVVPMLLAIIGLLACGATLWLLIVGLFLGFRYRIEGGNRVASSVNDVMGKAADAAEDVKQSFA